MNYLFSSLWIANLGVVPWLLFAFFLFLPMFFFLKFLLHLVCIVFEAMIYPFLKISLIKFQGEFVSICKFNVKAFFIISMIYNISSHASSENHEDLYLAKGEQTEIQAGRIESFSVGNKEVLASKYYEQKQQILIKGKSIGYTDLIIWDKNKTKKSFNIYIVSKREQLKFSQIANDFKNIGLKTQLTNKKIILQGSIKSNKDLRLYHSFKQIYDVNIISFVEVSKELLKENIAKVYQELGPNIDQIECQSNIDIINCTISPFTNNSKHLRKLSALYNIHFSPFEENFDTSNFEVQLTIYKVNFTKGSHESFGGYQASSTVQEMSQDSKNLINNNLFQLSGQQAKSQLLAKPKFITSLNEKQSVQLGSEVAYTTTSQNGSNTDWIFAGLKIDTTMKLVNGQLKLSQKTQITNPIKDAIQGGKSQSNIFLTPGDEQLLFDISYDSLINQKQAFPILGQIPILKKLFSNSEEFKSEAKLVAYIKVRKI